MFLVPIWQVVSLLSKFSMLPIGQLFSNNLPSYLVTLLVRGRPQTSFKVNQQ